MNDITIPYSLFIYLTVFAVTIIQAQKHFSGETESILRV